MSPFRPIFGNFHEKQARLQACKLENSKYNLFHEILRFHSSKEAVMNFAKYIAAYILAKLKYFESQIIFSNSLAHKFLHDISLVCFLRVFSVIKISKNGPKGPHS